MALFTLLAVIISLFPVSAFAEDTPAEPDPTAVENQTPAEPYPTEDPALDENTVDDEAPVAEEPAAMENVSALRFGDTPKGMTIVAHKIVCTNESQLPNWGNGGSNITSNTAQNWVNTHDSCKFVSGWDFQWGPQNSTDAGNTLVGEAAGDWHTFGPTDANGAATVVLTADDIARQGHLWFREVLQSNYIPFTYRSDWAEPNINDVSAEVYCDTDVKNYDNFDRISSIGNGNTVYCVAWNVPTTGTIIVKKIVAAGNAALKFLFNITGSNDSFELGDGEEKAFNTLNPGQYTVSEVVQDGWNSPSITCVSDDDDQADEANATGSKLINLSQAEKVTCTFTNNAKEVVDMCPNIDGSQATIPAGMIKNQQGQCIPVVTQCTATTNLVTTNLNTWDLTQTRSAGHNVIIDNGLRIYTDTDVMGSPDPRKAAGYYTVNYPLSSLGNQTIDAALDYTITTGIEPGLQLVIDFDNNGTVDGILVGEKIYGNNWWLSNSAAQFVKDNAPNNGGGNGSQWFGTPDEWLSKFPTAQVKSIGYSLGSGVNGDGVINSINLGCTNYTFDLPEVVDMCPNIDGVQATIPEGMIKNEQGQCVRPNDPTPACKVTVVSDTADKVVELDGAFAKILSFVHPGWVPAFGGANWIWGDNPVTDPSVEETQTFEKSFIWNGPVTGVVLEIAGDNTYDVSINGTSVAAESDLDGDNFATKHTYPVASGLIVTGENTLSIKVKNFEWNTNDATVNPAGLIYRLVVTGNDDVDCTEVPTTTPVCRVGNNLLVNGSFEDPKVGGDWNIFSVVAGWTIAMSDGLELWANGFYGGASDGNQNAELDGNAPTKITQNVATTPGATYELRFDFSARPDADTIADNNVDGLVNGAAIMNATANGSDIAVNTWSTHSQTFVATGTSTEIGLVDKGTANSYGSLVDNAVLCLVSTPNGGGDGDGGDDDDNDTPNRGGGGGGGTRVKRTPTGEVLGASTSTPAGQVLGDATSTLPVGAPNTGAGGTAQVSVTLPTIVAILPKTTKVK